MQLTDGEKLILIMLSEIHEKLAIPNGIDPKFVQEVIYSGNAWGLKWKYAGIFDIAESPDDVRHDVVNILDMWSFTESSYKDLSSADKTRIENESSPIRRCPVLRLRWQQRVGVHQRSTVLDRSSRPLYRLQRA